MTIIWYMVPQIKNTINRIFCHFGPFFALLPGKSTSWKNEKNTWRYYHFTHVYHKLQSYDVWFLRYGARQTEFFLILDNFLPFYPTKTPKYQNFEKMRKKAWRYYRFTKVHQKSWSYPILFLRYGSWQM